MMPQNFDLPSKPGGPLGKLDVFAGRWHSTGTTEAMEGFAGGKVDTQNNFEWLPGGTIMIHAWTGRIAGEDNKGIEVYTYDPHKGKFYSHFFGSPNMGRVYEMSVDDVGIWTFTGPTERGRMVFEDADTINAMWEYATDGINWRPLCEVRSRRQR